MVLERHRHHRAPGLAAVRALAEPIHQPGDLLTRPQLVDACLVGTGLDAEPRLPRLRILASAHRDLGARRRAEPRGRTTGSPA